MPIKEVRTKAISNIIPKEILREVQLDTINEISEALANSYGPNGSTTQIRMDAEKDKIGRTEYTKDGHKILGCLRFSKPIEMSIVGDLQDITRSTVRKVGDGTTSAVILSKLIFNALYKEAVEHDWSEKKIMNLIEHEIAPKIIEGIQKKGRKCTIDDIYNIAYTSTDGNEEIAASIRQIYEEFGMNAYIEVKPSNTDDNMVKSYEGITFDQGYFNSCFINDSKRSVCEIRNPKLYIFEDAIDTPEMLAFFGKIVTDNILVPIQNKDASALVPTVVFSTKYGEDVRSSMDAVFKSLNSFPPANRPPLLLITNISKLYQLYDLATLSGAKTIKKYIDPEVQQLDIERGIAPTPDTIHDFAGTAESIIADVACTKVINPACMHNPDGSYSTTYNALIEQLNAELKKFEETREEMVKIDLLKRRIRSLECNMVDFYIAGISHTDRNALIDAVEDALLNCRSASENGVGDGANFLPLSVLHDMIKENKDKEEGTLSDIIIEALYESYKSLYLHIYRVKEDTVQANDILDMSFKYNKPLNIRSGFCDGKVLTSIKADQVILEAICRIIGLMFKTNQAIVADPMQNTYVY